MNAAGVTAQALTYGPFCLLAMRVCLPRQFTIHFVETLNSIRCAIGHFEMFAKSPINHGSRGYKLQTTGVSSQREAPEQEEILTVRAASKASLHEPPLNCDFAHSIKSGVGDCEWRGVLTLLSGVERHRRKKSDGMSNV